MKLVAISRVRNEADIIEAFVRHHCVYFNKVIVLCDGGNDDTIHILKSLQAEGLPLIVLNEEAVAYRQSHYMTLLLHMAVAQFGAHWVVPLDADEFIEPAEGKTLADILATLPSRLFSLPSTNFAWCPEFSDDPAPNPVLRLRWRLPPSRQYSKVVVPAHLVDGTTQLTQGNHGLLREGRPVPAERLNQVQLCHFPIRDPQQFAEKVSIGYLKYVALPGRNNMGFHYDEPFRLLLADGIEALQQRLPALSYALDQAPGAPNLEDVEARDLPLRYKGGALLFSQSRKPVLSGVLSLAESMAKELATSSVRNESLAKELGQLRAEHAVAARLADQHVEDELFLKSRVSQLELELLAARELISVQSVRLSSRTFKLLERIYLRIQKLGMSPRALADYVFWLLGMR